MTITLSQAVLTTLLAIALPSAALGTVPPSVAQSTSPGSPLLIATAYTDLSLPTLSRGSRGEDVKRLQQILLDNGFLAKASATMDTGVWGVAIDGIFGVTTEEAVKDVQRQYNKQVTGIVTPFTWETLDLYENPYRSPLPWKF
jgi:peptidoglycan hydrolase-like protein with peptidoglycan-binding domain